MKNPPFSSADQAPSAPTVSITNTPTTTDDAEWDHLIAASPCGNVFLRSDWLRMLCETSSDTLRILRLTARDGQGRLRGGWAIPYREQGGCRFSHGFDFFYCGPLLAPDLIAPTVHRISERQHLLRELADAAASATDVVVAEAHPRFQDARAFLYQGWQVAPEYTHLWDLRDPEAILRTMNREKRREIRRAQERLNLAREDADDRTLGSFITLYRATMSRFSWYPTPRWETVLRQRIAWMRARERCRLYAARTKQGELLAAVLVLLSHEDETAYLWRMGNDPAAREAGAIPALYWHAALDVGGPAAPVRFVNFGGSPQPPLGQFKDYLGATPTLHFRLIHRRESARLRLWQWREAARDRARRLLGGNPALIQLYRRLAGPT